MELRTRTIERLRDALLTSGARSGGVVSSAFATLARQGLLSEVEKSALIRVDAVAEILFLVIAADEQIMDTEVAALRGAIRGLTGDALNDGIIDVMLEAYALRLRDEGRDQRLRAVAHSISDPVEAESALSLAAAVALADDDVTESESAVVTLLADAFGFDDARRRAVLGRLGDDARC